jgi:phage baseplate assembly protein gpV
MSDTTEAERPFKFQGRKVLLKSDAEPTPSQKKIDGIAVGMVINNLDVTGEARVQLSLPWLPGFLPWARVAAPMAGMLRGMYFIPQVGDEVVVAFNQGDVREPIVIGSLWNTIDRPPVFAPTAPVTERKIRTPLGHELAFDEALQSVTLTSNTFSKVTLDPLKAELSTPLASVTVGKDGDVTIRAATRITLEAPVIELQAASILTVRSGGTAALQAATACSVQGSLVKIN